MKMIGIVPTALFSALLIGTATHGFAQPDKQQEVPNKLDKHAQAQRGQQGRHSKGPEANGQEGRGQRQGAQMQQPARGDHRQAEQVQQRQQRGEMQQQRASDFDSQHRTWEQRGGYSGYRIPQDRFSASFGRHHSFHMSGMPSLGDGGRLRFQYGGYWMVMMDPYPEYWGTSWDQNDEMYVDYADGGYYLYDRRYPGGPGVALSISF